MTGPRRFVRTLLLAASLFAAFAVHAQKMVSVARPEINMRSGPGTQHDALWKLSHGFPLKVVARRGQWVQVSDFEADRGWVYRPLVNGTPHHVVKARVANIRKGPSTRARIVGKAWYGEVVRTLERRGAWVKVRHANGTRGWIARRLLWGW